MELTSKQRAQLRGMAANLDTILHVGKDGIGDNLIKQANDALEARELIKGRVLENSMYTAREAAEELSAEDRAGQGQKEECLRCGSGSTVGPSTPFTGAMSSPHGRPWSSCGWTSFFWSPPVCHPTRNCRREAPRRRSGWR